MSVFDEIPRSRALTPRVQTMPNARGIVAKPPALPAPPRGLATVPGQGRRTTANARGAGGFKNEIGRQGKSLTEQRRLLGGPEAKAAVRGGASRGLAGVAGTAARVATSPLMMGAGLMLRSSDAGEGSFIPSRQNATPPQRPDFRGPRGRAVPDVPRSQAGTPVQGNPLANVRQRENPSPLAQAATLAGPAPKQSPAWDARARGGQDVPMSPTRGAGSTAAVVPLPAGSVAPSDRTAKGLMQTTLNGGAYRYTPSAAEQATLGKASYSDHLQGAAPMASGAQVRAWEQPGALADSPMRGGFVGSTGLTDEDRETNLAYWQNVRQGVTQDIQRRALTKAAFNPGMDRIGQDGSIDTSLRQNAVVGLAAMTGGAGADKAGDGKAKGEGDWKRDVALEAMKGGNALELEAIKQAGATAETFRNLKKDQQQAVIDAVGFALPRPDQGGLSGVTDQGGVTDGQRGLALAFTSRLASQAGDEVLSNPFALTQIAGTVGQAIQQYPFADYGAALAAAQAQIKNPEQARETAALWQQEQIGALERALFGGEAGKGDERQ